MITVIDVTLDLELVAQARAAPPCSAIADVDCIGGTNGMDALHLLRFVAHLASLVTGDCAAIGST